MMSTRLRFMDQYSVNFFVRYWIVKNGLTAMGLTCFPPPISTTHFTPRKGNKNLARDGVPGTPPGLSPFFYRSFPPSMPP